jgi:hypothetical protein
VRSVLLRSGVFAAATLALLLSVHAFLIVFVYHYRIPVAELPRNLLALGETFILAVLLSAAGVAVSLATSGHPPLSIRLVLLLALAFSCTTIVAGPLAFMFGGLLGAALWFFFGAAAFALVPRFLRKRRQVHAA